MSGLQSQNKPHIAVIANFPNEIRPRAQMYFTQVFEPFKNSVSWEYITYKDLLDEASFNRAKNMDALVLSTSDFIISDPVVQEKMLVEMYLIREFHGPIFGMCFGHHLLEFMYGANVTEQDVGDFFNSQNIDFGSKKNQIIGVSNSSNTPKSIEIQFSPAIQKNMGTIINYPSNNEYLPLFRDDFNIQIPPPLTKIYAKQHKSLPIYGVDFLMNENSTEHTFRTAIEILQKFLKHFFLSSKDL
jgi:hypothetical protein